MAANWSRARAAIVLLVVSIIVSARGWSSPRGDDVVVPPHLQGSEECDSGSGSGLGQLEQKKLFPCELDQVDVRTITAAQFRATIQNKKAVIFTHGTTGRLNQAVHLTFKCRPGSDLISQFDMPEHVSEITADA